MAEQSFLNKLGLRLGVLGSAASLAIAAPLATGDYSTTCHTDAARTGMYFDRTAAAEKIGFIVGGQTGPVFTRSGSVVNVTINGTMTVGDGSILSTSQINGAAATNRTLSFQTAGVARWDWQTDSVAESGSDAGSNLNVIAYTDAGAVIDTPFSIIRASLGAITLARPISHSPTSALTGSQILLSTACTWNNGATTFTALKLNVTDTNSAAGSILMDLQTGGSTRLRVLKTGVMTATVLDNGTGNSFALARTSTITGNITDAIQQNLTVQMDGAFTVTRYNYFSLGNPTGTSTITNGTVFRFDAAAGTHKAIDNGTTKTTPGGVDAWLKVNLNATVVFIPAYLSKTA